MGTSPSVKKVIDMEMDFPQAMQAVIEGKKITKAEWEDKEVYVCLFEDRLRIAYPKDGKLHPWVISADEVLAKDWFVL